MSPAARRKSIDSSSSSDSDSSKGSHKIGKVKKDKKDKKDKKNKKDKDHKEKDHKDKGHKDHDQSVHHEAYALQHPIGGHAGGSMPLMPAIPSGPTMPTMPQPHNGFQDDAPKFPPSGYRVPLTTTSAMPNAEQMGPVPCVDMDRTSPVYFGSALFERAVHPCKVAPHLSPPCSVAYGGQELQHHGRFDLLPFDPNNMMLVRTSRGQIPPGKVPVEGGYEESGAKLYHAIGVVQGVRVPGKTGNHLGGCNVSFGGGEHVLTDDYEILCWK